jgi:hypothetical protein
MSIVPQLPPYEHPPVPPELKTNMLTLLAQVEERVMQGQVTAMVVSVIGREGQQVMFSCHGAWEAIGVLEMAKMLLERNLLVGVPMPLTSAPKSEPQE